MKDCAGKSPQGHVRETRILSHFTCVASPKNLTWIERSRKALYSLCPPLLLGIRTSNHPKMGKQRSLVSSCLGYTAFRIFSPPFFHRVRGYIRISPFISSAPRNTPSPGISWDERDGGKNQKNLCCLRQLNCWSCIFFIFSDRCAISW